MATSGLTELLAGLLGKPQSRVCRRKLVVGRSAFASIDERLSEIGLQGPVVTEDTSISSQQPGKSWSGQTKCLDSATKAQSHECKA